MSYENRDVREMRKKFLEKHPDNILFEMGFVTHFEVIISDAGKDGNRIKVYCHGDSRDDKPAGRSDIKTTDEILEVIKEYLETFCT